MDEARDHLPEEQERHRLAFEEYYALGTKRTYRQAAEKLGVSPSSIKLWSRTFNWRQRIRERDASAARQIADRSLQAGVADHSRNRKLVQMALMRLAQAVNAGNVRMQVSDLERLIRLQEHLDTSSDDRFAWIDRETDPEKLRNRLLEIMADVGVSPSSSEPRQRKEDAADE